MGLVIGLILGLVATILDDPFTAVCAIFSGPIGGPEALESPVTSAALRTTRPSSLVPQSTSVASASHSPACLVRHGPVRRTPREGRGGQRAGPGVKSLMRLGPHAHLERRRLSKRGQGAPKSPSANTSVGPVRPNERPRVKRRVSCSTVRSSTPLVAGVGMTEPVAVASYESRLRRCSRA